MSQPLRLLSLCSGIGVLDYVWSHILGQEIAGQIEIDPYRRAVLAKHWPDVPRRNDIQEVADEQCNIADQFGAVDLVAGGIPCQPFSFSGKRGGTTDHRYLWPQAFAIVQRCQPAWVFIENVAGFVSLALDLVQADLESAKYTTRAYVLPACAVGAPHIRERVFVLAHADCQRRQTTGARQQTVAPLQCCENVADASSPGWRQWTDQSQRQPRGGSKAHTGVHGTPESLADTDRARLEKRQALGGDFVEESHTTSQRSRLENAPGSGCEKRADSTGAYDQSDPSGGTATGRSSQPGMGGDIDGPAHWLDSYRWPALPGHPQEEWEPSRTTRAKGAYQRQRLQALGDAMVAQQLYPFLRLIVELEKGK